MRAALIWHTSRHHRFSASASAQPGRGRLMAWAMVSEAITAPLRSTSTPLVLPVPMSIPSSRSTCQTLRVSQCVLDGKGSLPKSICAAGLLTAVTMPEPNAPAPS